MASEDESNIFLRYGSGNWGLEQENSEWEAHKDGSENENENEEEDEEEVVEEYDVFDDEYVYAAAEDLIGADNRPDANDRKYGVISNPFGLPSPAPNNTTFDGTNMSAYPDEFQKYKVSSENGENFVKAFYRRMERVALRTNIASYFVEQTPIGAEVFPHINFNGSQLNAEAFQKVIEELPQQIRFDIDSMDADCVNPAIILDGLTENHTKQGRNMTISVNVTGTMTVGRKEDNVMRIFSDTFILVPNPKAATGRDRDPRKWLCNIYISRVVGT